MPCAVAYDVLFCGGTREVEDSPAGELVERGRANKRRFGPRDGAGRRLIMTVGMEYAKQSANGGVGEGQERKYGKARRIWVMDRGIVNEENLQAIRKRGGQYLVGTPRSQMKRFEEELLKDDWTRVRPEVEVKKVAIPQGEETYILCRTAGRK